MGRPSRTMTKFIDRVAVLEAKPKAIAVFGTYSGSKRAVDRSVKKLEKTMEKKLPKSQLLLPGLSVRVKGIPGPIVDGELPRCVDFGKKIADSILNL